MIFKKKTEKRVLESDVAGSQITEDVDRDVAVYAMPKRFLGKKLDANKAQKTGAIILVVGLLFLIAAGVFIYLYVFSSGKGKVTQNNSNNAPMAINKNSITDDTKATSSGFTDSEDLNQKDLISSTTDNLASSSDNAIVSTSTDNLSDINENNDIPVIVATTTKKTFVLSPDSDGDGLTDLEEVAIGTKPTEKDSDGDGYGDLAELKNLYNPAGEGKLLVNSKFEIYSDQTYGYTLYYPDAWPMNNSTGNGTVIFKINDIQFAEVAVASNEKKQTLETWYKEQTNVNFISPTQIVYKKGWTGVASEDGLHVYLLDPLGDKIYTFFYNIGDSATLSYKNIFDLMIASLK